MIVAAKQGAIAQWWSETLHNFACDGNDGLQVYARAYAVETLGTTKYRGKGVPDAIDDIALGIRGNCLVQGDPTARLAGQVQSQDSLHGEANATAKMRQLQSRILSQRASGNTVLPTLMLFPRRDDKQGSFRTSTKLDPVLSFELLHRQGSIKNIALQNIAAQFRQAIGDIEVFHPFGHYL